MTMRNAVLLTILFSIMSLLVLAFTWPASAKLFTLEAEVIRILDGDTVKVKVLAWPEELQEQSIRLSGIDTAETGGKAKCEAERLKAAEAKKFVINWLPIKSRVVVVLDTKNKDKYSGRILSDIYYKRNSLVKALKDAGLARAYDGGQKSSWCN